MTQDYSTEWRAALIERDMAVRAIVEFLEALENKALDVNDDELALVHIQKDRGFTDGFTRVQPEECPEFEMLKLVKEQLEKKLKR